MPGISAAAWEVPIAIAWRQSALRDARVGVAEVVAGLRGALAQPLEHEQRDPVDDQEGGGDRGGGEQFAQGVLQQQPEEPRGDGADDEQPPEPGVDVVLADLAHPQRAQDALDDQDPVAQEEQQQHQRRGEVGGDEEREEVGSGLVDVPAQQPRQHDRVPEARDRERLSDPLGEAENHRLEVGDQVVHRRESLWNGPATVYRGA